MQTQAVQLPETSPTNMHTPAVHIPKTSPTNMHMQTQAVQLPETSPTNMHTPAVHIPKTSPTNMHMHPLAPIAVTAPQHQRFLLFRDGGRGQGIGNIMNRLLATHLLALSYNRTCCVSHWPSFAKAFTRIPAAACAGVSEAIMIKHLSLWNFGSGQVDKKCWRSGGSCDVLMQSDEVFIEITGNEYPFEIFPQLPVGLFESLYTPSELLVSYFKLQAPWPQTVVHLRAGDNSADKRDGVDRNSLDFLVHMLPVHTFVITNNEKLHERFVTMGFKAYDAPRGQVHTTLSSDSTTVLQAWRDWYTIFRAGVVLHTPSAFSESAARASGAFSRRVQAYNKRAVRNLSEMLAPETWQVVSVQ
jgi:hypothetical protein